MNSREPRTIQLGEFSLTVSPLKYGPAKTLYVKLAPMVLKVHASMVSTSPEGMEAQAKLVKGLGATLISISDTEVSEKLIDEMVATFGAKTVARTVSADGQERTFVLDTDDSRDKVFGGDIAMLSEWLDFCVFNQYESVIKKMSAAISG